MVAKVSLQEFIEGVSKRAYYSGNCLLFYVFLAIANLAVIIWVFADHKGHPSNPLFLTLEMIVTIAIVLEISVRFIALRKKFWHECCNVFDFVIAFLCIVSLFVYLAGPSKEEEVEDVVSEVGLLVRNGLQLIRAGRSLCVARTSGHRRRLDLDLDLDLDDVEELDLEGEFDFEETIRLAQMEFDEADAMDQVVTTTTRSREASRSTTPLMDDDQLRDRTGPTI